MRRVRQAVIRGTIAIALLALVAAAREREARAGPVDFDLGTLNATITSPTSIAFGPDGRLYVGSLSGIRALTLDATGTQVVASEQIATGLNTALGIAFDPTAPSSPVVVYVSHQNPSATDSYEGLVSTFTGPTWMRADVITGLPSSAPYSNHFTNGLAFDDAGLLYLAQGSNTDAGLAGPHWEETPLSAAILIADVNDPSFDGAITYNPAGVPPPDDQVDQTGGDVSVYAPGTRNPYDLVVHTNGYVYATDNGPPGPDASLTCTTSGGPVSSSDELNLIEAGNYYGHPNRNRGRFDVRQCTYRAAEAGSGVDFTGPIAVLPAHCSCDGLAEYTSNAFGGKLQGDLILAEFINGEVSRIDLAPDGNSVVAITTLQAGYNLPLDVTVGPSGIIYVAEFGANRIAYLAPVPVEVGGIAALPDAASRAAEAGGSSADNGGLAVIGAAAVAIAVAGGWFSRRRRARR